MGKSAATVPNSGSKMAKREKCGIIEVTYLNAMLADAWRYLETNRLFKLIRGKLTLISFQVHAASKVMTYNVLGHFVPIIGSVRAAPVLLKCFICEAPMGSSRSVPQS